MNIFIDFDDVLFNTKKFIADLRKIFFRNGISEEIFKKSYIDYPIKNKDGKLKKYDVHNHIKILEANYEFDVRNLRKEVDELLKNADKYLFSDTGDFFKNFNKNSLYVVSYGDTAFQGKKIKNSGLAKKVKKIIITDKLKSEGINRLIKKNKIAGKGFFLDDRVEQIEDVKKAHPKIRTFLVKRKDGRYKDKKNKYCDFEVRNLNQAGKIIKINFYNGK